MTMTDEERKKILDTNFPSVQSGNTRPTDGVPTDFPYSVDFPQFMAKDKVLYTLMNLVIRQTLSNDKALKELLESGDKTLKDLIDSLSNRLANNDLALVTEAVKGLMSPEDKKKLDGIANNANNYSHPNSGVIAGTYKQVAVNAQGHVTKGSNPTTLAGYGITDAASKKHGNHVPTLESANNSRFLRNDNTWQTVTPANIGAPTTSGSGATGTWSINISGKANTATKADTATLANTATKAVDSDTLDGYHYADIVSEVKEIIPEGIKTTEPKVYVYFTSTKTQSAGASTYNYKYYYSFTLTEIVQYDLIFPSGTKFTKSEILLKVVGDLPRLPTSGGLSDDYLWENCKDYIYSEVKDKLVGYSGDVDTFIVGKP